LIVAIYTIIIIIIIIIIITYNNKLCYATRENIFKKNVKSRVPSAVSTTNFRERNAVYSGRYTRYHIPQYNAFSCIPVFNTVKGYSANLTFIFSLPLLALDRQRNQIFVALCSDIQTVQ